MAKTQQVAMRWSPELIERIDAFREKFSREVPGAISSRSDAVRVLLEKALAAEGFPAKAPRRRKS